MSRLTLLLPVCLAAGCGVSFGSPPNGTFTAVGNDTTVRFFHRASLLTNNRVMVTGGMRLQVFPTATLISLRDISFFNPATNSFTTSFTPTGGGANVTPQLLTARSAHTQTTLADGRVLITGGQISASGTSPGTDTATVEIFNPQTGTITAGPAMFEPRAFHTATLLPDGRVLVAGGTTWQLFDPTANTWSAAFAMQRGRNAHAAVLLENALGHGAWRVLLVAGGGSGPDTLELLDPATGSSVLSAARLSVGVDDVAAAMLDDGTVLIVGGQAYDATGNTTSLCYRYSAANDTLSPAPPPPNRAGGIADHQMLVIGQFALIFGGEQQQAGQDTELTYAAIYNRVTNAWEWTGNSTSAHDDAAAVQLADGRILLIDGGAPFLGNELPSSASEVFTPQLVRVGDTNGDGVLSAADVPVFVNLVLAPATATPTQLCAADTNGDMIIDAADIQGFALALIGR